MAVGGAVEIPVAKVLFEVRTMAVRDLLEGKNVNLREILERV
jgi:hypothetical protein